MHFSPLIVKRRIYFSPYPFDVKSSQKGNRCKLPWVSSAAIFFIYQQNMHSCGFITKTPTKCCFLGFALCWSSFDASCVLFVMSSCYKCNSSALQMIYNIKQILASADTFMHTLRECICRACVMPLSFCVLFWETSCRDPALHILFIYTRTVSPTKGWKSFQTSAVNGQIILPQIFRRCWEQPVLLYI